MPHLMIAGQKCSITKRHIPVIACILNGNVFVTIIIY